MILCDYYYSVANAIWKIEKSLFLSNSLFTYTYTYRQTISCCCWYLNEKKNQIYLYFDDDNKCVYFFFKGIQNMQADTTIFFVMQSYTKWPTLFFLFFMYDINFNNIITKSSLIKTFHLYCQFCVYNRVCFFFISKYHPCSYLFI